MGNRNRVLRPRRTWCAALLAVVAAALLPLALGHAEPSAEAATKWVSSARVSPAQVARGGTVAITASVTSPGARTVLVDLEVHNAADQMVGQRFWDQQTFAKGQTRQYQWAWTVPSSLAPGEYTVKIGVFGVGWESIRSWNDDAAAFEVTSGSPTTTTTTSSTTTTTAPTTSTTSSTTTTTTRPSTSTTSSSTTTTTMPPDMDCAGVPMETPIGALPPAMPMFCDTLRTGVPSTFINGTNSWVDDFEHGASMADLGPGYVRFEKSSLQTGRTGTFRHNNHWMVDVLASNGQVGGSQMRPDRSFRFENGKLVVETDVAAGIEDYDGFAWPEITVTTASSPASQAYGPTPAKSVGDDLYAYGQFGGYDSIGIRLTGARPIEAYYDDTQRGFPCGRVFELSWFQDGSSPGTGECPKARQFTIWGGGEWAAPGAVRFCAGTDPDINCRDRFRWELTKTSITLYANGRKLMEHTALPGFGLPDRFINSPVYVYFSDWVYQGPNRVVRFHWDRVAVNP
jgi:hypothetical protein